MKAAAWRAPSVPVCIPGSGSLQAPPSLGTATPGNCGASAVWGAAQGLRAEEAGAGGTVAGGPGAGLGWHGEWWWGWEQVWQAVLGAGL